MIDHETIRFAAMLATAFGGFALAWWWLDGGGDGDG